MIDPIDPNSGGYILDVARLKKIIEKYPDSTEIRLKLKDDDDGEHVDIDDLKVYIYEEDFEGLYTIPNLVLDISKIIRNYEIQTERLNDILSYPWYKRVYYWVRKKYNLYVHGSEWYGLGLEISKQITETSNREGFMRRFIKEGNSNQKG